MIRSPEKDTDFFDKVAGVLLGGRLAPYLFILCLDHTIQTFIDHIKGNDFLEVNRFESDHSQG